jgi:hypothetical protein
MKTCALLVLSLHLALSAQAELQSIVLLKQRYSSVSDSGVTSYEVGREGMLIENRGATCLVGFGETQVEIPSSHLTSDRAEVEAAIALQRRIAEAAAAEKRAKNELAAARNAADEALRIEAAKNASIAKQQAALAAAEKEKAALEREKKESVRRGNDPNNIENRARADRIRTLRLAIYDLKTQLGLPVGRRPE